VSPRTAFVAAATLIASGFLATASHAQEPPRPLRPGDRVRVTSGPAPVKVGRNTLAMVTPGTVLTVDEVREEWVKVSVKQGRRTVAGWIHSDRVRLLTQEPTPSRPEDVAPSGGPQPAARPRPKPERPRTGLREGLGESSLVRFLAVVVVAFVLAVLLHGYLNAFCAFTDESLRPQGKRSPQPREPAARPVAEEQGPAPRRPPPPPPRRGATRQRQSRRRP
jgi:hypothetical protein